MGNITRRLLGPITTIRNVKALTILVIFVVYLSIFMTLQPQRLRIVNTDDCDFLAMFNFSDSNSDTGGKSAAFHRLPSPNCDTFFHKPSGRYSDGLFVLDFLAEKLELPFLSVYLNSMDTNFRHGANFATGGSTIQPLDARIFDGGLVSSLWIYSFCSLNNSKHEWRSYTLKSVVSTLSGASSYIRHNLPRPEDFSKALYMFDIGRNDLHSGLKLMTEEQLKESVSGIINRLVQAVETVYQHGARAFWIHNTGPIGCLPYSIVYYPPKPGNTDKNGCIMSHNEVAQEFNRQLKDTVVSQLRLRLTDAVFTYVDIYSAKFTLISEAKKHSFTDRLGYCCGHYGEDYHLQCGKKAIVNGTEVFGAKCSNPSNLYQLGWHSLFSCCKSVGGQQDS